MSLTSAFGGSKTTSNLTRGQQDLLAHTTARADRGLTTGVDQYQGQLSPNANSLMNQSFNTASGITQQQPGMQSALQQQLAGAGNPQDVQNYYQSQLGASQNNFQEMMRGVRDRYGSTYGASGALPRMEGLALGQYGAEQDRLLGQLTYDDRNASRDRQLGGINAGIGMQQQNVANMAAQYGMGQNQRGLEAEQNAEAYQKWQAKQAYNNPWLQLLGPTLGTQALSSRQVGGIVPGTVGAIAGIAGAVA